MSCKHWRLFQANRILSVLHKVFLYEFYITRIWRQTALGVKLVYSLIGFVISLPVTCVRHPRGNCQKLPRCLLKKIRIFIYRLLQQMDCRSTAKVNYVFKLLPRQLNCRPLNGWNSIADIKYLDFLVVFL